MHSKNFLTHPFILAALGAVVVIAIASGAYYVAGSKVPVAPVQSSNTTIVPVVSSGVVEPAQNPDLAFQSGGRVARVAVAVSDHVVRGQLLASLDTSSLAAQRAQAAANQAAQQAILDGMQAGPRTVDVNAKQTAVDQANLTLENAYQTIENTISDAYGKSYGSVHSNTDTLFDNPDSSAPSLVFMTSDGAASRAFENDRVTVNSIFSAWQQEIMPLSSATANADIDRALADSLTNLTTIRAYANTAVAVLGIAVPTSSFSQTTINSYLTTSGTMRDTISTLITSLQSGQQSLAVDKLAVQSAQNALDQVLAGSTAQAIEAQQAQVEAAQASVANFDAQIGNAQVIAPFQGTVASVHVKLGDIVAPNTAAVSLDPSSALQITAYVSESDVARITTGQRADVTLDAYGTGRHFAATVASIDRSPTMQQNIPAYKVTLQFTQNDPAISSGMTANISFTQ